MRNYLTPPHPFIVQRLDGRLVLGVPVQRMPHPPQLTGSLKTFVSHPFPRSWSQSARPGWQRILTDAVVGNGFAPGAAS